MAENRFEKTTEIKGLPGQYEEGILKEDVFEAIKPKKGLGGATRVR